MSLEYIKGYLLALHLGRRKDAGLLRPEQVSIGKLNNVREALEICRTARTILGANGISLEYPVIRHANNLESVLTYEGTVEMHTLVLGQAADRRVRLPLIRDRHRLGTHRARGDAGMPAYRALDDCGSGSTVPTDRGTRAGSLPHR